jgi:hypothetical protein
VSFVVGSSLNARFISGRPRYNYGTNNWNISEEHLAKRERLRAVANQLGIDLRTAALQFSAAPDVPVSLIVGADTEAQALANATSMKVTNPQAFSAELKRQNLIERNAPVPEGGAQDTSPRHRGCAVANQFDVDLRTAALQFSAAPDATNRCRFDAIARPTRGETLRRSGSSCSAAGRVGRFESYPFYSVAGGRRRSKRRNRMQPISKPTTQGERPVQRVTIPRFRAKRG